MWGLHWAEVSIEPIKAFLYYRLSGRKMPRLECYVALNVRSLIDLDMLQ